MLAAQCHNENVQGGGFTKERETAAEAESQKLLFAIWLAPPIKCVA